MKRLSLLIVTLLTLSASAQTKPATTRAHAFLNEIEAFEAKDKQTPPPADPILFVGSSSIRIWDVKAAFPDAPVLNRGFGGSTIADSLFYADRIILPYHPRTIIFYAGDNDIAAGKSPYQVAADFTALLNKIRAALPQTKLVVIAIKPSLKRWSMIDKMRDANRRIVAIAATDPLVTIVPVEEDMLTPAGTPRPELFRPDGLHMNPAGYEIWNKKLKPFVDSAVQHR